MNELDKIKKVHEKSQELGIFLDWLGSQDLVLCKRHEHDDGCKINNNIECGFVEGEYISPMINIEQLLADYFKIDLRKVEEEKQKILKEIQKENERR